MKQLLLYLALTTSALANVITIGPGVEKDGKKYFLQFPDCKSAFYAGDDFTVESVNLSLKWNSRFEQSKKFLTPAIVGYVRIKDTTRITQTDLSSQIAKLKQAEASSHRKLYDKCSTVPEIKLLSGQQMEVDILKDEHGSVKLLTTPGKMVMSINLNPLIPEHDQFLHKLLNHRASTIQLKLSALQEIASCKMQSSYEYISRFQDVVYYTRVCRDTKVCKKYWFVTECWEEYKCQHIPHKKRIFLDALLKDDNSLELSTRPGTEENVREYLLDQCLDGFLVSTFMSRKTQDFADGSQMSMDTLVKEYKDNYSFQTSVIESYPNKLNLALKMQDQAKAQIEKVYTHDRFDCFKDEDTIWFPENHYCIKEILK